MKYLLVEVTKVRPIKNCEKRVNSYLAPTEILNFSMYGRVVDNAILAFKF